MPTQVIKKFDGGFSLVNPRNLDNNQFVRLKNMFYNKDKRVQTRRGYTPYFPVVPDAVVLVHDCEAATNWSVGGDGAGLGTASGIRGTNALEFDVDVSVDAGNATTLANSSLSLDLSAVKSHIGFWLYVPASFNTNLTAVKVRLGTDSSNYYEWTLGTLTEDSNNYIKLNYDDASSTGTLNDASITYFRLEITYTASYTDKSNLLLDDIRSYSSTYGKPVTSYFFNKDNATGDRVAMCVAGDNLFLYQESAQSWEQIDDSLTEYETAEGRTTHRTRWDTFAHNGSGTMEFGMCNGIDNYRKWNGTAITEYGSQPKCRYFLVSEDTIYSTGADAAPLTLYSTNAAPSNVNTLNTNDIDAGNEFDGRTNGLFPLAGLVMVAKDDKVYYYDSVNDTMLPIDHENGGFSHRATANVGNGIFIYNSAGIDTLKQKGGATGGAAVEGELYTEDLRELLGRIAPIQRNANCGLYLKELTNYYFTFDANDDNIPESTIVYSSLVGNKKAWSEYTYPQAYQYGIYEDPEGVLHYILCSAVSGVIYEIEKGFDDDGSTIEYDALTKEWDFEKPTVWKSFKAVDAYGLKSLGEEIKVEVYVDGEEVISGEVGDEKLNTDMVAVTVGSDPIGSEAIGGGGGDDSGDGIDMYPYYIRLGGAIFAAGVTIQVRLYSEDGPIQWTLDKMEIRYDDEVVDIFPTANIA